MSNLRNATISLLLVGLAIFVVAFQRYSGNAQALVNGVPANSVTAADVATMAKAAIPSAVKRMNTTTDANGAFTVSVTDSSGPFQSSTPVWHAETVYSGGPTKCQITARSASSVSGICYVSTSQTLPGTLTALSGLVINPWGGRVPAGTVVMIVGGEPTQ